MKKNNDKEKNIIIGILIGIIICLVIALVFVSYNKFVVVGETEPNNGKDKIEDNIVHENHRIELEEKSGSCTGMNFTYKDLLIDGKKIDLGFTNNSNSCLWTFINDYEKTDDFIVLDVDVGFVNSVKEIYIIDYNGNILKEINTVGNNEYVEKYYIEHNTLYIEAYGAYQSPCNYKKNDVAGGLYKLEYLGNNKFSEIQKKEDKTINDMLKLKNTDYDTLCKH